ncbi:MAG: permease [Desulfovibrionaceae bacterium]|nr:permease [Desulfovibrionaceae bacterium]
MHDDTSWKRRYWITLAGVVLLWWVAWVWLESLAALLIAGLENVTSLEPGSRTADALIFFVYDTGKILLLLVALIYGIAWMRAGLDVRKIRQMLAGRRRVLGYGLGALFGAVTPFCSCSSVPLFLGFTSAGIPVGVTLAFLITSPLINELAVILLWNLLGWKFTLVYVSMGLLVGILGGLFMDSIRAGRWLRPFVLDAAEKGAASCMVGLKARLTLRRRHGFALSETVSIFRRVWKWVVLGVAVGALIHGFVPQDWFAEYFGTQAWYMVPAAVMAGLPLYTNVTGIVPIMESLLLKGLPLGTTLAFCMSSVAASIPEMILLRQIMTARLQVLFLVYLWVFFTLMGWAFNSLQSLLVG